jgi:hypothetical protein
MDLTTLQQWHPTLSAIRALPEMDYQPWYQTLDQVRALPEIHPRRRLWFH